MSETLSTAEHFDLVKALCRALVEHHRELTLRQIHRMANTLIARHGLRNAPDHVGEVTP